MQPEPMVLALLRPTSACRSSPQVTAELVKVSDEAQLLLTVILEKRRY